MFLLSRAQLLWPTNLNCSRRKRLTKYEIEWQCLKIDRPTTKLKRAFAHSRVSGTKLKTHFLILNEEMTKMGGKTYTTPGSRDQDNCGQNALSIGAYAPKEIQTHDPPTMSREQKSIHHILLPFLAGVYIDFLQNPREPFDKTRVIRWSF